jgi:hypothetical protein
MHLGNQEYSITVIATVNVGPVPRECQQQVSRRPTELKRAASMLDIRL